MIQTTDLPFLGPKNYFLNPGLETGRQGWGLFNTTLTSKIPTGSVTAGAASITTFTTTSTNPLTGTLSLRVASSGAITAGHGFISDTFTIDRKDQAKVMGFSFSFEAISGTMDFSGTSANTWAVYIYDVTASAWIQPAGVYNLTQSSGVGLCSGTFQTTAASTQYRLAVVCITATGGAVEIKCDDFQLGPQKVVYGSPITDWVNYTPTITHASGGMTNATSSGRWRRVGDTMEVTGTITFSNPSASFTEIAVSLPTGYSFDLNKTSSSTSLAPVLGTVFAYDSGTTLYGPGNVALRTPTTVDIRTPSTAVGTNPVKVQTEIFTQSNPFGFSTNDTISWQFQAPIQGWSSSVQMSNDTDTRVISAQAACSTAFAYSATTPINFDTVTMDRSGSITTSATAWKFTAPVSGDYRVSVNLINGVGALTVNLFKGGSFFRSLMSVTTAAITSASTTITLNAGEYIDIRGASAATLTGGAVTNTISIERLSGPATIAASDTVAMSRTSSVVRSIPASSTGNAFIDFDFTTGLIDTHNAWRAGVGYNSATGAWTTSPGYVVPVSGVYSVNLRIILGTTAGFKRIYFQKNGVTFGATASDDTYGNTWMLVGHAQTFFNAGDLIQVIAEFQISQNLPISVSSYWSGIEIVRV